MNTTAVSVSAAALRRITELTRTRGASRLAVGTRRRLPHRRSHRSRAVEVPPRHWPAGKPLTSRRTLLLFPQQPPHGLGFRCSQGVGKTTLVMRVFETLRGSHPNLTIRGLYTRTAFT